MKSMHRTHAPPCKKRIKKKKNYNYRYEYIWSILRASHCHVTAIYACTYNESPLCWFVNYLQLMPSHLQWPASLRLWSGAADNQATRDTYCTLLQSRFYYIICVFGFTEVTATYCMKYLVKKTVHTICTTLCFVPVLCIHSPARSSWKKTCQGKEALPALCITYHPCCEYSLLLSVSNLQQASPASTVKCCHRSRSCPEMAVVLISVLGSIMACYGI